MQTHIQNFFYFFHKFLFKNKLIIGILFFTAVYHPLVAQEINYQLSDDSVFIKPDYRNHLNIPEYNPALMPLDRQTKSTGVWTELNPKVPRVDYLGIHFVNKNTGWAVGANGTIIKTTNGGSSWTNSFSNTTTPILKIRSNNGQIVIASGFGGMILRSTDGGDTFTQVISNVTGDLWGLQMLNDTLGWACGISNSLTKTTDGGQTWQRILTPGYTSSYWWIDFLNENYGFIAADGKVLRTVDGGNNWEIIQAGDAYPLFCIDVIDSLHIAAAGYGGTSYRGKNIYSSDGGNTWINGGPLTFEAVNDIKYVNPDTGYVVMTNVIAKKTTNRGQEWIGIATGGEYEMQFFEEDNIGYSAGTELRIYKTEDNFDVWNRLIKNDNFADVFFTSEQKGFAISGGLSVYQGLYKTPDGGVTWESVPGAIGGNDLFFIDSLTGFIASNSSLIFKTTDGGNNWYATNGITNIISRIFFINSQIGWAAGGYRIFKTTDGGENWFEQMYDVIAGFKSIYLVDSIYGWTANNNRPYKTIDGGFNWIRQTNLDIWQSRDVLFKDYLNGFLLESNKLYKTSDGGITFNLVPDITGFSVAAKFANYRYSTIFITGFKTFRSIDGGLSWFDFNELTGTRITSLNLLGMGSGYAVGELGLILRYFDESVPVELISFTANQEENIIKLKWDTATEINNQGFLIERKKEEDVNWKNLAFIDGAGTSASINHYEFRDELFQLGKYKYRLKQIDFDGQYEYSSEIEIEYISKTDFYLSQNFPNPFNSSTIIKYSIMYTEQESIRPLPVTLKVYDIMGNEIIVLVSEEKSAGNYEVRFEAAGLASGVYFYKLTSGGNIQVRKLIYMK